MKNINFQRYGQEKIEKRRIKVESAHISFTLINIWCSKQATCKLKIRKRLDFFVLKLKLMITKSIETSLVENNSTFLQNRLFKKPKLSFHINCYEIERIKIY